MAAESDDFSDIFGCVFHECVGYQSPLPIALTATGCPDTLTCLAIGDAARGARVASLFGVELARMQSVTSLGHIVSRSPAPIALPGYQFYRQLRRCGDTTTVVSREQGLRSVDHCTFFRVTESGVYSSVRPDTCAVALDPDSSGVWCASAHAVSYCLRRDVFSQNRIAVWEQASAQDKITDVQRLSATQAVASSTRRMLLLDSRTNKKEMLPASLFEKKTVTSFTTSENRIFYTTDNHELVGVDLANPSEPFVRLSFPLDVSIRSASTTDHAAVLLTHQNVAIFDLDACSCVAAFRCGGSDVLSADLVGGSLCATTTDGMLYISSIRA